MSLGFEDEFDYLDDESLDESTVDAPSIKGSSDKEVEQKETEEKKAVEKKAEEEKIKEEEAKQNKEPEKEYDSTIFVVKVTTNKEDKALEMVADKVKKKKVGIYALARPHGIRGYIFLESPDRENAEEAAYNLPYVKGILPTQVSYEEIRQMVEPVASEVNIEKNDVIEMISEPFKKEKAKVVRVDKVKGEVVVSLLNAAVPIPVTVKLDNVRVIRREELEE
ncbi:transcription elongation factor Spt5 [Candidatus Pacearchaeota archaeon]|jgi:transcriptional antiterminator NusG|nr:transcription elongation factor Spt5 [Candidatus Pacearchaeota archaeon]|tara:strand:+ start:14672 stop:15337 length:666 start_codon:yes stop_codon:yes gene_type:complete